MRKYLHEFLNRLTSTSAYKRLSSFTNHCCAKLCSLPAHAVIMISTMISISIMLLLSAAGCFYLYWHAVNNQSLQLLKAQQTTKQHYVDILNSQHQTTTCHWATLLQEANRLGIRISSNAGDASSNTQEITITSTIPISGEELFNIIKLLQFKQLITNKFIIVTPIDVSIKKQMTSDQPGFSITAHLIKQEFYV